MLITLRKLHDNIRKSMIYQFDGNFEKLRFSVYEMIPKVLALYEVLNRFAISEESKRNTLEDTKWLLKELIVFLKKDIIRDIDIRNINESITYYMNRVRNRTDNVDDLMIELQVESNTTGGGIVLCFSTFYVLIAYGNINEETIFGYFEYINYMLKDVIANDWTAIIDLKKVDYHAFPLIEKAFLETTKSNIGDNKAFVVIENQILSGFAANRISSKTMISSKYQETFEWLCMNNEIDIRNIKFIGNITDILELIIN